MPSSVMAVGACSPGEPSRFCCWSFVEVVNLRGPARPRGIAEASPVPKQEKRIASDKQRNTDAIMCSFAKGSDSDKQNNFKNKQVAANSLLKWPSKR